MYAPVMSHRMIKFSGDSCENVGMNVAPPPPGPSFSQVVVAGFSLVSDDVLHAANAVSRISSLDDKFNAKQF
jgi:hypothetical protein